MVLLASFLAWTQTQWPKFQQPSLDHEVPLKMESIYYMVEQEGNGLMFLVTPWSYQTTWELSTCFMWVKNFYLVHLWCFSDFLLYDFAKSDPLTEFQHWYAMFFISYLSHLSFSLFSPYFLDEFLDFIFKTFKILIPSITIYFPSVLSIA